MKRLVGLGWSGSDTILKSIAQVGLRLATLTNSKLTRTLIATVIYNCYSFLYNRYISYYIDTEKYHE